MSHRTKTVFVSNTEYSVEYFLRSYVAALASAGPVVVVAPDEGRTSHRKLPIDRRFVEFERKPHPVRDVKSLVALIALLRREKPDVVYSVGPKGGLLGQTASRLSRVPVRVHTFTGQVWATKSGFERWYLRWLDRLTGSMATNVLVDSPSQLDFLESEGVLSRPKGEVLGAGSISGVDTSRFSPNSHARSEVVRELEIDAADKLVAFMGRLTAEKGIVELLEAFALVATDHPRTHLILVGQDDGFGEEARKLSSSSNLDERVHFIGTTSTPETYLAAADLFVLPSHREGFGNAALEASSCGVAVVASNIYGLSDAVVHGETGVLHPPHNAAALAHAMGELLSDDDLRRAMGIAGRARAADEFTQERLTDHFLAFHERATTAS